MLLVETHEDLEKHVVSSGFRSLDSLLPRGGVTRGSLVEWLGDDDVSGRATLACAVGRAIAGDAVGGGAIIIVDRGGRFHPPAVMPWLSAGGANQVGSRSSQLIVVRPSRDDDEVWAIDQALRCPGVAAVLAWPKRIHPTAMRRWQLAARSSQAVGLLVRPDRARREPSWAMDRIAVASLPGGSSTARRLRLALAGGPWSFERASGGGESAIEQSVEIVLDLVNGREALGAGRWQPERRGAACRAS